MTNTCRHLYDEGGKCNSAAVTDQRYCSYHLRYRARQLRMAQIRARNERFDLKLPPLESMYAVQSALSQLAEALAADMIDPKRADRLIRVLNIASRNLLKSDKWPASPYHSAETSSMGAPPLSPSLGDRVGFVDLNAEYGLPPDLDVNTPPEVAFPSAEPVPLGAPPAGAPDERRLSARWGGLSPSFGDRVGTTDESNDPFVSALRTDGILSDLEFRPDYPVTPEYVEMDEIRRTLGSEASLARSTEMMRNERRRRLRTERKRYARIAAQINLQRAADKLAERKLAERDAQHPAYQGCPPPSVGGVGLSSDTSKKPVASTTGETLATKKEAATA